MDRFFACLALGLAGCLPLAAQAPSQPYQLRESVQAVVLDVAVKDARGRAVANLTADDFAVTEDGAPQKIDFFQGAAEHTLPAVPDTLSGGALIRRTGEAPLTTLLLDEVSTEPEDLGTARKDIADYLRRQPATLPSPTNLLALTGSTLKSLADYTLSRDALIAAIEKDHDPPSWYVLQNHQVGFKSTNYQTAGERMGIYIATLNQLATAGESFHVRKNVVWIGPGLPALNQTLVIDDSSQRAIRDAIHRCVTHLVRARVTLYTVDPQGLLVHPTQIAHAHNDRDGNTQLIVTGGDPADSELAFEQLAPATGGTIFRLRNDLSTGIAAGVADGATYYTLSYRPTNRAFDGRYRRIKVALRDPHLIARSREGYIADSRGDTAGDLAAQAMGFAITSNIRYEGIAVTARLQRDSTPPSVRLTVSPGGLNWAPDPVAEGRRIATVHVVAANVARDGKVLDDHVSTMRARAGDAALTTHPAEFFVPVTLNSKAATLRMLVRDQSTGRIGTVDLPLRPQ